MFSSSACFFSHSKSALMLTTCSCRTRSACAMMAFIFCVCGSRASTRAGWVPVGRARECDPQPGKLASRADRYAAHVYVPPIMLSISAFHVDVSSSSWASSAAVAAVSSEAGPDAAAAPPPRRVVRPRKLDAGRSSAIAVALQPVAPLPHQEWLTKKSESELDLFSLHTPSSSQWNNRCRYRVWRICILRTMVPWYARRSVLYDCCRR